MDLFVKYEFVLCCQQQIVSVKTEVVNPQTPGVSFFVPTVFGEREHDLRLFIIVRRKRVDNSVVVVFPVLESLLFHKVEGAVLHSAFDEVQVLRIVCAFESDDGVQLEFSGERGYGHVCESVFLTVIPVQKCH